MRGLLVATACAVLTTGVGTATAQGWTESLAGSNAAFRTADGRAACAALVSKPPSGSSFYALKCLRKRDNRGFYISARGQSDRGVAESLSPLPSAVWARGLRRSAGTTWAYRTGPFQWRCSIGSAQLSCRDAGIGMAPYTLWFR